MKPDLSVKYGELRKISSVPIRAHKIYPITKTKCFCAACMSVQDTSVREPDPKTGHQYMACEECGNISDLSCCDMSDGNDVYITRGDFGDAFLYLPLQVDVMVAEKDGKLTRLEESVLMEHVTVYESGKSMKQRERMICDRNMEDHEVRTTVTTHRNGQTVPIVVRKEPNIFAIGTTQDLKLREFGKWELRGDIYSSRYNDRMAPCAWRPLPKDVGDRKKGSPTPEAFLFSIDEQAQEAAALLYDEVAKKYGFPGRDEVASPVRERVLDFVSFFPAVTQREISIANTNMMFDNKRRTQNGEEPLPEQEQAVARLERVKDVMAHVALMDVKLAKDLSRMDSTDQVGAYLKAAVFGGVPEVPMPSNVKVKPAQAVNDGFKGKRLRTAFNIDPYAAASNVRTALKLGFHDPNHLNALLDIADASRDSAPYVSNSDKVPALAGMIRPIESQEEMRLAKLLVKNRGPAVALQDIYGAENVASFVDSAMMYKDISKYMIATTQEELDAERTLSAMAQVVRQYRSKGGDIAKVCETEVFQNSWGVDTEKMVRFLLGKNGEYEEEGRTPEVYLTTTDRKPLFKNRTIHEVHAELVSFTSKTAGDRLQSNFYYTWTEEQMRRGTSEFGGYRIRLAESSNDLIRAGQELFICVGASHFDSYCRDNTEAILIMENPSGGYEACIEADKDITRLYQFKAAHNGALLKPAAIEMAKAWMQRANISGCRDTENFGNPDYYPYGRGNFNVNRVLLAEGEVRLPSMAVCERSFAFLASKYGTEAVVEGRALPDMAGIG